MKRWWIVVLVSCGGSGPRLEVTNARHVMMELEAHEMVSGCEDPCLRLARPGERVARCSTQGRNWDQVFDLAALLGPEVSGYAICTLRKP